MNNGKIKKLNADSIGKYQRHALPRANVLRKVTSTNDLMRSAAKNGAEEGYIIAADSQSDGRGRIGKSFYSPDGGLYLSILLRPDMSISESLLITACAAVTTAEAIEEVTGKHVQIKWVNDLYLDGKKVCGILTEAPFDMETCRIKYAVLGIGINVFEPDGGYGELDSIAASLVKEDYCDSDLKNRLAAAVADRFFDRYDTLSDGRFIDEYRKRLFILDRDIYVIRQGERVKARVLGLENDFSLTVRYENGEVSSLNSGEISIIPT